MNELITTNRRMMALLRQKGTTCMVYVSCLDRHVKTRKSDIIEYVAADIAHNGADGPLTMRAVFDTWTSTIWING